MTTMNWKLCVAILFLASCAVSSAAAEWFSGYKSYAEYNQQLDNFAVDYPTLVTPITLGQSYEGRAIRGIRVSGNGASSVAKKAVAIDGLAHAREWIAGMVPMYAADQLLRGYGINPRITNVMDNVEFLITPIVNPDGYEYSRTVFRQWRKNRRLNADGSYGIDLNRNFSVGWGLDSGSSGDPSSNVYRGTSAFSEPESQAVRDLFLDNEHIVSYINFHSYGQVFLKPWGYTTDAAPDDELLDHIAGRMASSIHSIHGETYEYGDDVFLYLSSGTARDWTYGDQGAYSFVIELRPDSFSPGFELPPSEILPTGEEMFPAILDLAEFAISLASGDFNDDGSYDCSDVDALVDSIVAGSVKSERDLNGDTLIDGNDLTEWLTRAGTDRLGPGLSFLPGDANLDGLVDGDDFSIWHANRFTSNPSWCSGDFNADGLVNGRDFVAWNANKFSSIAVPEVHAGWIGTLAIAALAMARRH